MELSLQPHSLPGAEPGGRPGPQTQPAQMFASPSSSVLHPSTHLNSNPGGSLFIHRTGNKPTKTPLSPFLPLHACEFCSVSSPPLLSQDTLTASVVSPPATRSNCSPRDLQMRLGVGEDRTGAVWSQPAPAGIEDQQSLNGASRPYCRELSFPYLGELHL